MSFLQKSTPKVIFFSCMKEAEEGGATPLCDFIKVAKEMDPEIKSKFEKKGVTIYRNYVGPNQWSFDPWKLKRWPEIYKSTEKSHVEKVAKQDELEVEWFNGDALRLTQTIPAFKKHSRTGETVWANHSDVFHTSQAYGEYSYIVGQTGKFFHYLLLIFLYFATFIRVLLIKKEDQAMNATFGDKTAITDSEMEKVRKVVWKNMVIYKWQQGDVIMLDNQRVSHGRMPFSGKRLTICGWGEDPLSLLKE